MLVPFGLHKGQPIERLPTRYLIWALSRDNLRFKYPDFVGQALRALRTRLGDLPTIEAELRVDTPPPPQPKKPKVDHEAERRRKLAELERKRAAESRRKREDRILAQAAAKQAEEARSRAERMRRIREGAAKGDATYVVMLQRMTDASDLV